MLLERGPLVFSQDKDKGDKKRISTMKAGSSFTLQVHSSPWAREESPVELFQDFVAIADNVQLASNGILLQPPPAACAVGASRPPHLTNAADAQQVDQSRWSQRCSQASAAEWGPRTSACCNSA